MRKRARHQNDPIIQLTTSQWEDIVDQCTWRFAKSMPWIPHWYVVRDKDIGRVAFRSLVRYIWANGRVGFWGAQPRQTHLEDGTVINGLIYYENRGHRYWTMGYPLTDPDPGQEENIINREERHRVGIRWADEGATE